MQGAYGVGVSEKYADDDIEVWKRAGSAVVAVEEEEVVVAVVVVMDEKSVHAHVAVDGGDAY